MMSSVQIISGFHCVAIVAGIGDFCDKVIITFVISASCALYCMVKPVFADINLQIYNINSESKKIHIVEYAKAIVAVDFIEQTVGIKKQDKFKG